MIRRILCQLRISFFCSCQCGQIGYICLLILSQRIVCRSCRVDVCLAVKCYVTDRTDQIRNGLSCLLILIALAICIIEDNLILIIDVGLIQRYFRSHIIYGVHPAAVLSMIFLAQRYACSICYSAHIESAAFYRITIGNQAGFQSIPCGLVLICQCHVLVTGNICEVVEAVAKHVYGYCNLLIIRRIPHILLALDYDIRGYRSLVELLELLIAFNTGEFLPVLSVFIIGKYTVDRHLRIILRLLYKLKRLAGDDRLSAGAESSPVLRSHGVISRKIIRLSTAESDVDRTSDILQFSIVVCDLNKRIQGRSYIIL